MRLVLSWLRDFVDIPAPADEIAERLGLRGFEVASVESLPNHPTHPELADGVIDFEVTANRPDCLSVIGLAREVATAFQIPFAPTHVTQGSPIPTGDNDRITVTIEEEQLGPRYAGAVGDVSNNVATPAWMRSRLEAAGVRPISAIVDITNYVLMELGHPMHAFDLAKLAGAEIRVRRAQDAWRQRASSIAKRGPIGDGAHPARKRMSGECSRERKLPTCHFSEGVLDGRKSW